MKLDRRNFLKAAGVATGGVLVGGALGTLAGCSTNTSTPSATSTGGAPAVVTGKPVTLRYWSFLDPKGTGPREKAQTAMIAQFERDHPNVKVEVETLPWDKLAPQFIAAAQAGNAPDVFRLVNSSAAEVAAAGVLTNLEEILPGWSSNDVSDFPGYKTGVFDKKLQALFIENRIHVMYYRKDLLEEKGLSVPQTWDELVAAAKAVQTADRAGLYLTMSREKSFGVIKYFYTALWGRGGEFLDSNNRAVFNSPAGVAAVQWAADMILKDKIMPTSVLTGDSEAQNDGMAAGSVAFTMEGTQRLFTIRGKANLSEKVQVAALPGVEQGKPSPSLVEGWMLAAHSKTKYPKEVGAFIMHHTSAESMVKNAAAGEMPARKSAFQDPWFKSEPAKELNRWSEIFSKNGRALETPVGWAELNDQLILGFHNVILNKKDPKAMLDEVAAKWNAKAR